MFKCQWRGVFMFAGTRKSLRIDAGRFSDHQYVRVSVSLAGLLGGFLRVSTGGENGVAGCGVDRGLATLPPPGSTRPPGVLPRAWACRVSGVSGEGGLVVWWWWLRVAASVTLWCHGPVSMGGAKPT